MKKDSLVTITFPVFERTTYFIEAIESAINQTVEVPIIVVDNASSHYEFQEICSKYGDRIKYFRNNENIGMFGNWNKCFELVDTKYAIIVGDDDILSPTYIEEFYKAYEINPDIDVYYTGVYFYALKDGKFSNFETNWINRIGRSTGYDIKSDSWKSKLYFPTISCIIRVDVQKKYKFETRLHTANDKLFIYTLPDQCVFYGNSHKLYRYRLHETNDSNGMKNILEFAHSLILITLRNYSNLSFWNLLKCYGRMCVYLRKEPLLKQQITTKESFYSSAYKELTNGKNVPIYVISWMISYIMEARKYVKDAIFLHSDKNLN